MLINWSSAFEVFIISAGFLFGCNDTSTDKVDNPFPEAEKQNINSEQLVTAFNNAGQITAIQGIAVARNDIIVAERFFNSAGPEPDPNLHVMSVTKSITSLLTGIAIEKGFIQSVNQHVSDFLDPEVSNKNPDLGEVTIQHLLTMTCGQDWKELGVQSEFSAFVSYPDQLNYIFNKPVIDPPGTVFNYSDGTAHLLSAILTEATQMSTSDFASQYLFKPMGLEERIWSTDNRNIPYGGVRLYLGLHDMIKIGFLILHNGVYDGAQVVSSEWIDESTSLKISTNNIIPFLRDYGYFWWLGKAYDHDFICANGYGGQFILIVKDLNLVMVSRTDYRTDSEMAADQNWYDVLNILINQVLPAVRTD